LAVVWIFRDAQSQLPKVLLVPSALAILALACDVSQYVWAGARWHSFVLQKEADPAIKSLDDDVGAAPDNINNPATVLYYSKLGLLAGAYIVLLCYAGARLFA
jgi:hypothetical protein